MIREIPEVFVESGCPILNFLVQFTLLAPRPYYHEFVHRFGREFPEKRSHTRQMAKNQCFGNAFTLMLDGLGYCEGFAFLDERVPFAVHHAWNIDSDGTLVESTWEVPGAKYIGCHFQRSFVELEVLDHGWYGVFNVPPQRSRLLKTYFDNPEGILEHASVATP